MPARRKVDYIQGKDGARPIQVGIAEDRQRLKNRVHAYLTANVTVPRRRVREAITETELKVKMATTNACWRAKYKLIKRYYHVVGDGTTNARQRRLASKKYEGDEAPRSLAWAAKKAGICHIATAWSILKRYEANGFKLRVSLNT